MHYPHINKENLLGVLEYGSRLYGTYGPNSDYDFKGVYLPTLNKLLLSQKQNVLRERYSEDGLVVGDHESMPANGWEAELIPVQKFVHDYFGGQAYAMELVYAIKQGKNLLGTDPDAIKRHQRFQKFCSDLSELKHKNVSGMIGFAMKQTFDYVKRGERYSHCLTLLEVLADIHIKCGDVRLDDKYLKHQVLDEVASAANLKIGQTENNGKNMRTLMLNGREYLETTKIAHLYSAVQKLADEYGARSVKASDADVDWKSLSHAVRVFEQVIEYLDTGFISFPRKNSEYLKAIKEGNVPFKEVQSLIKKLDAETEAKISESKFPEVRFPEGGGELMKGEELLLRFLHQEYFGEL